MSERPSLVKRNVGAGGCWVVEGAREIKTLFVGGSELSFWSALLAN